MFRNGFEVLAKGSKSFHLASPKSVVAYHYLDGHAGQKTFAGRCETQYISSAMDLNAKCRELEKEVLNFSTYLKNWFSVLYIRLTGIRRGGFFGNFLTNPSSDSQ